MTKSVHTHAACKWNESFKKVKISRILLIYDDPAITTEIKVSQQIVLIQSYQSKQSNPHDFKVTSWKIYPKQK